MEADIPTTPSSRGLSIPHHEALKCPLFFDPRGPPAHSNHNALMAMEKKALRFAKEGFTRIEHISSANQSSLLTQQQFSALLPQGSRLLGYAGVVDYLPPAV